MTKLSWEETYKSLDELANKIKASGFEPDYIIGITNGGLIPLYFLIKKLGLKNVLTVSASSYEKQDQKELKITYLPEIDLSRKSVLLVDEIAETGMSLHQVSGAISKKYNLQELKTATLAVNTNKCKFLPDFYVIEEKGEWVVFPWEKDDFPEYF